MRRYPLLLRHLFVLSVMFLLFASPLATLAREPLRDNPTLAPPAVPPPRPANSHSFQSFVPVTVPDDGYLGTRDGNDAFGEDAGMVCSTINTAPLVPSGAAVANVGVNLNMTHARVGDLTVKLRAPGGGILTLLNRPGSNAPDDGSNSPIGDNSNWNGIIWFDDSAAANAETLGSTLGDSGTVCADDSVCTYSPAPDTATQPPLGLTDFRTTAASGMWTLCVGDSASGEAGTLNRWELTMSAAEVYDSSMPPGTIPDIASSGGLGTVTPICHTQRITSPTSAQILGAFASAEVYHRRLGDLNVTIQAPNGMRLTVVDRPGTTSTNPRGDDSNWGGALLFGDGFGPEAESMGATIGNDEAVCEADGICAFDPAPDSAPQPPSAFSDFIGTPAAGNWTFCVGDRAAGDIGTFNDWHLYLERPAISLAITLESMSAEAMGAGARVRWATASEIDNLGFHLYRSTDPAVLGERLNGELIPSAAPGGGQGANYEWVDSSALPGTAYYYTLEDLDINGVGTAHPPVPLASHAPTAVTLSALHADADSALLPVLAGIVLIGLIVGLLGLRSKR